MLGTLGYSPEHDFKRLTQLLIKGELMKVYLQFDQTTNKWSIHYGEWMYTFTSGHPSKMYNELMALGSEAPDAVMPFINMFGRPNA